MTTGASCTERERFENDDRYRNCRYQGAANDLGRVRPYCAFAPNPVKATYTFNAAGTGEILNGRQLTDLIADFNRIHANYAASAEWAALSLGEQNNLTTAAQLRVDAIAAERFRAIG